MTKILVVDDEPNLLHSVGYNLRREGYDFLPATDGLAALALAEREHPDAIILDIMLPGIDGFEVCRRLRQSSQVPILMLTAKDSEIDRVVGLEIGADDYLTKPFSMRELLARVRALLRRSQMQSQAEAARDVIRIGELEIDRPRRRVLLRDTPVELRPKEFDLLAHLAAHAGQVFSRDQLLSSVWGYDFAGDTRTVDVHIRSLRQKLSDSVAQPRWLETVRGVGYRFRED